MRCSGVTRVRGWLLYASAADKASPWLWRGDTVHTKLNGRVALVTGGTGAIGTAICKQLAASGARVVATYRNAEKARTWQEKCKADGHEIGMVEGDVTNFDS